MLLSFYFLKHGQQDFYQKYKTILSYMHKKADLNHLWIQELIYHLFFIVDHKTYIFLLKDIQLKVFTHI
jgi:hypothetical protein